MFSILIYLNFVISPLMLILPSVVYVVCIFHISFSLQVAFSHIHAFPTLRWQNSQDSRSPDAQRSLRNCSALFCGRSDQLRSFFCCLRRLLGRPLRHTCIVSFSLFLSNNYQFHGFPRLTVDSVFTGQFPISSFQFHFNVSLKLWAGSMQKKEAFILVVVTHS